jgi:HNH endonuclease
METNVMHYRQIWEHANDAVIPKNHEIHHVDGNRTNNDPSNLICVSIEEHLQIHLDQEDWGAVHAILIRMDADTDKTMLKLAASKAQTQRWINGTHNWQINESKRKERAKKALHKRIAETGNAFGGIEDRSENARKGGTAAAEKKAGFLNTNSEHHGSKAVKNTTWWTDKNGKRKRSAISPGKEWCAGMKYEKV